VVVPAGTGVGQRESASFQGASWPQSVPGAVVIEGLSSTADSPYLHVQDTEWQAGKKGVESCACRQCGTVSSSRTAYLL
jgi:hypothetical protein